MIVKETSTLLDIKNILIQGDNIFTKDNIFIGLDLDEDQRSKTMKMPFFVILKEQFNSKRVGQDHITYTPAKTSYTSLKTKNITIIVKTYQQVCKINDVNISSQEIINSVSNGIINIITHSGIVSKIENVIMTAGSKNTTGQTGMVQYQCIISISHTFTSTTILEKQNTFDIKNVIPIV